MMSPSNPTIHLHAVDFYRFPALFKWCWGTAQVDGGLEILEVLKPNWSEILCPDAQLHSFLPMMMVNQAFPWTSGYEADNKVMTNLL
jgi:hypothetical protein